MIYLTATSLGVEKERRRRRKRNRASQEKTTWPEKKLKLACSRFGERRARGPTKRGLLRLVSLELIITPVWLRRR